jgi:Lrp/AsnC family transcriptional regulator, leucine-responsive regulatory protein
MAADLCKGSGNVAQLMPLNAATGAQEQVDHGESFVMNTSLATERNIDKIDIRISRILQADGRIGNLKLAEEVHLSPTAVLERVKRLTREGYILGYEARLNPLKLGAGLLVFVEILLDRTVRDVMDTFKAAVQVRTEILEAHLVAGGFDYLLKTRVADMAAYREFIGSVIWTLPGVRETRTCAVVEEVKNSSLLPVAGENSASRAGR